ncbi:MAG TPA: energy transducer TonB [Gammaproteobacteria bacterium]|nr:energy transducer TonB [Gammaproteobacteria bacterium]|tara:strand:- start:3858 stop:4544 length:687 start_codon:yes stop_codon:yes gene_type:complete
MKLPKLNILESTKNPSIVVIAIILNIAIFILIQRLVSKEHDFDINLIDRNFLDFTRVIEKPIPPPEKIEDIEPPPEEEDPPPPEMPTPEVERPQQMDIELSTPEIDVPMSMAGEPYLGEFSDGSGNMGGLGRPGKPNIDSNVVPSLRIPPNYPNRALRSGIEGIVTVEFTITTDGSVKDAEIIEAEPPNIFDKSVLRAIAKWKFNPDMVDGQPVEKRARQDIKFTLKK